MQQSNIYIVLYAAGMTIVLAVLLSLASEATKGIRERNAELDKRSKILSTAMDLPKDIPDKALYQKFEERVNSYVINSEGEKISPDKVTLEEVNLVAEYKEHKQNPKERALPVYEIHAKGNSEKVEAVVLPMYGFGLWDLIWAYVCLEEDMSTIRGVSFDHKGETEGLGARIRSEEIQSRYEGKKIFKDGKLKPVTMLKGEGNNIPEAKKPYTVDGMAGATMTRNGLNKMLNVYLNSYKAFILDLKKENTAS